MVNLAIIHSRFFVLQERLELSRPRASLLRRLRHAIAPLEHDGAMRRATYRLCTATQPSHRLTKGSSTIIVLLAYLKTLVFYSALNELDPLVPVT
jgi:hypothetical protein